MYKALKHGKMPLSNIERNVFKFLKDFHFYLSPFPLQWDDKYEQVFVVHSVNQCWISLISLTLCTLLYASCSGLTAIYMSIKKDVESIEILVQLLIWWSLTTVVFIATVVLRNINELCLAFNKVLQMGIKIIVTFFIVKKMINKS